MYLTAQHVQSRDGGEGIHTFLHMHDVAGGGGFPPDPLTVPQEHPGRLVDKHTEIPMGMNSVLSYLDVIAGDEVWREGPIAYWRHELEAVSALMNGQPLPWVVEAGDMHLIFSVVPTIQVELEFDVLV